jgi:hypothetical protein
VGFIAQIPCSDLEERPDAGPERPLHRACVRYASVLALMLTRVVAALFAVCAGALIGVIQPGQPGSRAGGPDRRAGLALSGRSATRAKRRSGA